LEDARRSDDSAGFAGRHDRNRLSFGAQARVAAVMSKLDQPLACSSAHTHRGDRAAHRLGRRSLLEFSVSSFSDWPIACRRGRNRMACRAVISARIDYELTSGDRRGGRGQEQRHRPNFLRIEAKVGME
jgi:hypothetical protein